MNISICIYKHTCTYICIYIYEPIFRDTVIALIRKPESKKPSGTLEMPKFDFVVSTVVQYASLDGKFIHSTHGKGKRDSNGSGSPCSNGNGTTNIQNISCFP